LSTDDIDYKAEIDRHFLWFETKLPAKPARFVSWLRKPSSRLVRFPLAILLVIGGIFSFLPILGLWMLPLGLILIAQDIPPLQKPVAQLLGAGAQMAGTSGRQRGKTVTKRASFAKASSR